MQHTNATPEPPGDDEQGQIVAACSDAQSQSEFCEGIEARQADQTATTGLEADKHRAPGKAAAERLHQDELAALHTTVADRDVERHRH